MPYAKRYFATPPDVIEHADAATLIRYAIRHFDVLSAAHDAYSLARRYVARAFIGDMIDVVARKRRAERYAERHDSAEEAVVVASAVRRMRDDRAQKSADKMLMI